MRSRLDRVARFAPPGLAVGLLLAAAPLALGDGAPPGLVSWKSKTVTVAAGEMVSLRIEFAEIPVRRFTLLVEGGDALCDLNAVRIGDGSLVHDAKNESRHEVDVPWGTGESLAVSLLSRTGGVFTISLWGPPAAANVRSYSYEVNRALEAYASGRRDVAAAHCRSALLRDPDDLIAGVLLRAFTRAGNPGASPTRIQELRDEAAVRAGNGEPYAAIDLLLAALDQAPRDTDAAVVLLDLGQVFRSLDNTPQARLAFETARVLGLPPELDALAAAALAELPPAPR